MSATWWGAVLGALGAAGLLLAVARVRVIRRPQLELRVLPYVRDLPQARSAPVPGAGAGSPVRAAADLVERVLGGTTTVRRRVERAGLDLTVHEFRVQQVLWGVVAFAAAAAFGLLRMLTAPTSSALSWLVVCAIAAVAGVLARDTWLTSQVRSRERRILAEFPTVAELLALSVAAGEGPVAALDRVVRRSAGELSRDLARVLADIRTGEPVGAAFDRMAAATGLPVVARFAQGVAVAVERGTPLADVLRAQSTDVREAGRRELIETAARKEVFMMVPVVFLVLPVTVLFAFWPGVIGLSLTAP